MKEFQDVTMSSLIAGYFLAKGTRIIEFNAITNLLNDLYMCENIDVMETDEDIDKIIDMIKKIGKRYKNHKLTNTREIYVNETGDIVTRAQK